MGTITLRKTADGTARYRAKVSPYGRRQITKTFTSKSAARAWIKTTERDIEDGSYNPSALGARRTLSAAIDLHILEKVCVESDDGTTTPIMKSWKDTRNRLLRWRRELGSMRLDRVDQDVIYGVLVGWGVEGSTWTNYRNVLASCFKTIAQSPHSWISINKRPTDGVPRQRAGKRERVMTGAEYAALQCSAAEMAAQERTKPSTAYIQLPLYLEFLYQTACRRSEALDLEYKNVDFASGRVKFLDTKNGRTRESYITPERLNNIAALPRPDGYKYLFYGRFPQVTTAFDEIWREMVELAGIVRDAQGESIGQHHVRHTAITEAADQGASLTDIMAMSGHISEATARKYIHSDKTAIQRAQGLRKAR
jgi:integrase